MQECQGFRGLKVCTCIDESFYFYHLHNGNVAIK